MKTEMKILDNDNKEVSFDEMREKMKEMEDIILRQYIELASTYVCSKCRGKM